MESDSKLYRSPRVDVDWPIIIQTDQKRIIGKIINVSAVGAFICCHQALESDEIFAMAITVPSLDRHIMVSAKVIRPDFHCLDEEVMPHGMGVVFTRISDEDKDLVSKVVSDQLDQME